jgi:hypothetical protein
MDMKRRQGRDGVEEKYYDIFDSECVPGGKCIIWPFEEYEFIAACVTAFVYQESRSSNRFRFHVSEKVINLSTSWSRGLTYDLVPSSDYITMQTQSNL